MEERIIDDEYGRGIRLRKTEDGYVDVTDELAPQEDGEEGADEVSFEFPVFEDEDDEDLAALPPEEALALRKKKEEAAKQRKADYEKACQEGEALLENGDFAKAEQSFEKALHLDEVATRASIGYWRAKTENFAKPDVLIDEYADEGMESMEYDLGIDALDTIRTDYKGVFEDRLNKLREEEKPLSAVVEEKQTNRRKLLSVRLRNSIIAFAAVLLPTLVAMILTAVFGAKIPTTRENTYILPTIILGVASLVLFFVSVFFANKFANALRIYRKNERLSSSAEGKKLVTIRAYAALYEQLLAPLPAREQIKKEDEEEAVAQTEEQPASDENESEVEQSASDDENAGEEENADEQAQA